DRGAAEPGDVVEALRHPLDRAAVKAVGRGNAAYAPGARRDWPRDVVLKAVDHQEIDELLAPLAGDVEIAFAGRRGEVDVGERNRVGHRRSFLAFARRRRSVAVPPGRRVTR